MRGSSFMLLYVLVSLRSFSSQSAESQEGFHAVTAVGSRMVNRSNDGSRPRGLMIDMRWNRLAGLYLHDDRQGPYLKVQFDEVYDKRAKTNHPVIGPLLDFQGGPQRNWRLAEVLLPLNSQIRYPLWALHRFLWDRIVLRVLLGWIGGGMLEIDCWLTRPHDYFERQILDSSATIDADTLFEFHKTLAVPRYVAVLQVRSDVLGRIDVLVDMTSTPRNDVVVAIMAHEQRAATKEAMKELSDQLGAPPVFTASARG